MQRIMKHSDLARARPVKVARLGFKPAADDPPTSVADLGFERCADSRDDTACPRAHDVGLGHTVDREGI
jgi:hypothetical protein